MKWHVADFFVIAIVLVCALAIWLYPVFSEHGGKARIKQGGEVKTISLNKEEIIELDGATVKVFEGKIAITESDCPDKVCVKTGEISKKGESIVCVPNGIVITIEGKRAVDAVAN